MKKIVIEQVVRKAGKMESTVYVCSTRAKAKEVFANVVKSWGVKDKRLARAAGRLFLTDELEEHFGDSESWYVDGRTATYERDGESANGIYMTCRVVSKKASVVAA